MIYVVLLFVILYFLSELEPKKTNIKKHEKTNSNPRKMFHNNENYSKDTPLKETIIAKKSVKCEKCGANVVTHNHHILAISKEETSNFDDLQLLCNKCHMIKQHHKFDKVKSKTYNDSQNVSYLRDAIRNEKTIKITYKKLNGEVSHREILPIGIYKYGGHSYLKAYCYLRNEKRTFRISRITKSENKNRK
jgi:hypothetical protein